MPRWFRMVAGLTALRVLGQAVELAGWALLARRLGPSAFGVVAVAFLIARWGALVADWGAAQRGARDVSVDDGSARALARIREVVAVAATVAFVVGALIAGRVELVPIAAVALQGGFSREWVAIGQGRAGAASVGLVARGVVLFGGALFVSTDRGAASVIGIAYLLAALISVRLIARPNGAPSGRIGAVSAWALVMVLGAQVYTSIDTVLLDVLRSSREAGIYNALYRIPSGITTVVGLVVAGLVPAITRQLRADTGDARHVRDRAWTFGLLTGLAVVAATPLAVAAVPLVFGDVYREGRFALALVLLATAAASIGAPLGAVMVALGAERALAVIVVGGAAVNVVGNLALIPKFGMAGAGWATLASEVFVLVFIKRAVDRQPRWAREVALV